MKFFKNLFTTKQERNVWLHRNDACWCGSGKKYKKCHMTADEPIRKKEGPLSCSMKG